MKAKSVAQFKFSSEGWLVYFCHSRSTVCRPAEWPRGFWPAWVRCFRMWTQVAVFFRGQRRKQEHRPLTRAPDGAAARKRETVPRLPQTHTSPTAKQHLLSDFRPSKSRQQAKNLVHCSHCSVSRCRPAGGIPFLYAVVDWFLLSWLSIQHGANQGGRTAGIARHHTQRMGGRRFPRSSFHATEAGWAVERLKWRRDKQQNVRTILRTC